MEQWDSKSKNHCVCVQLGTYVSTIQNISEISKVTVLSFIYTAPFT